MKILIADDHDLSRQMISDIVATMGHELSWWRMTARRPC